MANLVNSIYDIHYLDELSCKKSFVHSIDSVIKLIVTVVYIATIISFDKYDVSALIPLIIYPITIFIIAEIPVSNILKRVLLVMPFIIGIGIFNPIFDGSPYLNLGEITISAGWISFSTLILKSILTVLSAILLIATTGMDKLAMALRKLKVPKIFVTQILLTYRYIYVLMEEGSSIIKAYHLRAPTEKNISIKYFGTILGNMLLRTFDRAGKIYDAMLLRGFDGEYRLGQNNMLTFRSILYLIIWTAFFILVRLFNISELIGYFMMEVIK